MPYTPHTADDVREMLARIGVGSLDDLFVTIPQAARVAKLDLPAGKTEEEVRRVMKGLAARNRSQEDLVSFLGGGVYDSIIPAAVVDHPELVNNDPLDAGWLVKVKLTEPGEVDGLLSAGAYEALLGG